MLIATSLAYYALVFAIVLAIVVPLQVAVVYFIYRFKGPELLARFAREAREAEESGAPQT